MKAIENNMVVNGVTFNKVDENGARIGYWMDLSLGMIIYYVGNGDSQVMRAGKDTATKLINAAKKMFPAV